MVSFDFWFSPLTNRTNNFPRLKKMNSTGIYHCACAKVNLLARVAKPFQHHPTTSNNIQQYPTTPSMGGQTSATSSNNIQQYPTSPNNAQHGWPNQRNIIQQHPTISNITQQRPAWVAKPAQHLYPTLLAFVGQKCWAG